MRQAVAQNAPKVSDVAIRGYEKKGPGFVWCQFMFKGEWLLRVEFMPIAQVRQLGMRKDTMEDIDSVAAACDPLTHAALLIFKGDHLESLGLLPLKPLDPDDS